MKYQGDAHIVNCNLPFIKKWLIWLDKYAKEHGVAEMYAHYGDWAPYPDVSYIYISIIKLRKIND